MTGYVKLTTPKITQNFFIKNIDQKLRGLVVEFSASVQKR
jgi:hypothetical protein